MTKQHQVHTKNLHRRGPDWRRTKNGHHCRWPGCSAIAADRLWGCREHWMTVPMELRDAWMAAAGKSFDSPAARLIDQEIKARIQSE